ncbi:MAG: NAD(P)/FAD-dependent oxidoreductase [Lachnospiraceae bacterium]|nr:NAD(P)/FAD-dependent oxidoreductase [Lachnospiraceae bacterium]
MNIVDMAIVGSGPAGISAALNAKIRNKSHYLFGTVALSDKVRRSECISNYPGVSDVGGMELHRSFTNQLSQAGIEITEKRITGIYYMGEYFALLADQEEFYAKTVILATGVETIRPVPGERELLGRGVSYCATCDGNLYRGKKIAVVCDNIEMEEEVSYLSELAETIYYLPIFKGSNFSSDNAERLSSPLAGILGEKRVSGVRFKDGTEISVDGVFFLKESVSPAVLLPGLSVEDGHVAVNRNMETNIKGCYAAGDCTGVPYQIAKAVGEGNVAAHSAIKYLAKQMVKSK